MGRKRRLYASLLCVTNLIPAYSFFSLLTVSLLVLSVLLLLSDFSDELPSSFFAGVASPEVERLSVE